MKITGSHIGDTPVFPGLLNQLPAHQQTGSVTADGAHDTSNCHDAIADRSGHVVIPSCKNAKPWTTVAVGAVARNEALRALDYLGRSFWRRWRGYHRRSSVKTKIHFVKSLGQKVMVCDFDRQVAEVQIRIAALNGCTALGIPVTAAVGKVCLDKTGSPPTSRFGQQSSGGLKRVIQINRRSKTDRSNDFEGCVAAIDIYLAVTSSEVEDDGLVRDFCDRYA